MFLQARTVFTFCLIALLFPLSAHGSDDSGLEGKWSLLPEKSSEIGLYRTLTVEIQRRDPWVTVIQKWGTRRSFTDTLTLRSGGVVNKIPVRDRVWPTNVFMGISMQKGSTVEVRAFWEKNGRTLRIERRYKILASQGPGEISSTDTYELAPHGELLTLRIDRSTRRSGPDLVYVFKRAGTREAYFMNLEDDWRLDGKLPLQAMLISLQGVANRGAPRLYFIYPETWAFTYTPAVFDFYKDQRYYTFRELRTPEQALETLKDYVKGYVVWDKEVRTSLIIAFTVAGLEDAVVVSEELIPMVEDAGLKPVADFRGQFRGQTDAQIYSWAYDQYWERCSRDFVIWMGGESGPVMKPGVADWGIYQRAFFNDLSTKESDKEEYALANKILSQMNPLAMVMGWHSYAKDRERDHVKLTSSYGLRVEGLHTLPNLSFSSQVPMSPGFKFTNRHNVAPGEKIVPEEKVYIACIQTDGLGIGAWLKPGRGEIPYAWEVIMNYLWLAPAMQEFFYSTATPNDYFIGALSGPGYLYPKAVPPEKLPALIAKARELMQQLDLRVFEIMDYSEGATVEGNTELTRRVVDAYYQGMPEAIGFVNGYAPAFTFTVRDGRPLISYDYYLSPTRPEADAVADLEELAAINKKRPYFLLMHVRESSDIKRVKSILDQLGPEFEVVPLDVFLTMAGQRPTFKERFLEK